MFGRRAFVAAGIGLFAAPFSVHAQSTGKVYRIGYLTVSAAGTPMFEGFREVLRELGWVDGVNVVFEYRHADGQLDRLHDLAADLVRLKVDVISAGPTAAAVAARKTTATTPIVMANTANPVELGLVASLARPGGNVTGVAWSVGLETIGKGLQLLKEAVPKVRRVAVVSNPANPNQAPAVDSVKATAQSLGLTLLLLEARDAGQVDRAVAAMTRERVDAAYVLPENLFLLHRARIATLLTQHRLPSMFGLRENVEAGGLLSYGPNVAASVRRAAVFVDKILKGARPADLPVEQPTKFELAINLKTAKALGRTIPPAMLLRADHVIE